VIARLESENAALTATVAEIVAVKDDPAALKARIEQAETEIPAEALAATVEAAAAPMVAESNP
jgi:hypothetical protein